MHLNSIESILRMWNAGQLDAGTAAYSLLDVLDAGNVGLVLPTLHHFIYVKLRDRAAYCAQNPTVQFFGGECPLRGYEPHRVAAVVAWIAKHGPARDAAETARRLEWLVGVWKMIAVREAAPIGVAEGRLLSGEEVPRTHLTLRMDRTGCIESNAEITDFYFRLDLTHQRAVLEWTYQTGRHRGGTASHAYQTSPRFEWSASHAHVRGTNKLQLYPRRPNAPVDEAPYVSPRAPMTEYEWLGAPPD